MSQISSLSHADATLFAGAYTLRETAVLLRATTPPRGVNLWEWKRRHNHYIEPRTSHLAQWISRGMGWDEPVRVSSRDRVITFADLVRLRMVAMLRSRGIAYKAILVAEDYVRQLRGIPQPFITEEMWTAQSDVFIRFTDKLIAASQHGQIAFEEFMAEFLAPAHHGLSFAPGGNPTRWQPSPAVLIDPEVQFGAPCIEGTRIETRSLWSLKEAGDSVESLAEAFSVRRDQVAGAIEWERRLSEAAQTSAVLSR